MPRGSKSVAATTGHRTKAEKEARQQAEQDMLSGKKGFERANVRNDPVAHAEFKRVSALMKAVGKDDALYFAIVNRYCELFSEVDRCQRETERLHQLMGRLEQRFDAGETEDDAAFMKQYTALLAQVNKLDDKVMQKRKMMLDLEKENGMTVAAALRAIPKGNAEKKENPLAAILGSN